MKRLGAAAASAAVLALGGAGGAYAADLNAMPVKALPIAGPAVCTSIVDFFTTACQVAAYGVRFYGTIDVGFSYQTNASAYDKLGGVNAFPAKNSFGAKWLASDNNLSPSAIGVQVKEPLGAGWSFVGQLEAGFRPYSLELLNGVHSVYTAVNTPLIQEKSIGDSNSQGAFYNGLGFTGVSHDTWGTLTFFRQNSLGQDLFLSYDPMGMAGAFSVPGFFGGYAGGGVTENRKDTTAIKYRVNVANWHFGVYGQVGGYDEGNAAKGAIQGNIGVDWNVGPGVLSTDVEAGHRKSAVSLGLAGAQLISGLGDPNGIQNMSATVANETNVIFGAKYQVDRLKLFAGYEWIQFKSADETYALHTGFTDIAGDFVCVGCQGPAFNFTNLSTTGFNGRITQLAWFGGRYALTDALDLSAAYYHVWQNDYSLNAGVTGKNSFGTTCAMSSTAVGACAGTLDAAAILLDWRFAPKWDTYIGTLYSRNNGGLDSGFLAKDSLSTTAGLRFRW
jgi:predicted porin